MTDESEKPKAKSLGQAIDAIVGALQDLDAASRASAIRASCDYLSIALPEGAQKSTAGNERKQETTPDARVGTDVKALKEQKNPTSSSEMAALVAFYLSELAPTSDRTNEVTVAEMVKYFKQAGFPLPKATRQLLHNAKNAGYFDSAGAGKFKLNPVGYNLVQHNLPRSAQIPGTGAPRKTRRPRRARRGK